MSTESGGLDGGGRERAAQPAKSVAYAGVVLMGVALVASGCQWAWYRLSRPDAHTTQALIQDRFRQKIEAGGEWHLLNWTFNPKLCSVQVRHRSRPGVIQVSAFYDKPERYRVIFYPGATGPAWQWVVFDGKPAADVDDQGLGQAAQQLGDALADAVR
jgi:hypothetical protein